MNHRLEMRHGFARSGVREILVSLRRSTYVLVALEIVVVFLLVWRPTLDREIAIQRIMWNGGQAYVISIHDSLPCCYSIIGNSVSDRNRSSLKLERDGHPFGSAHSLYADIREFGNGAFSHWQSWLFFSTPGNTDPRRDGHRYSIKAKLELTHNAKVLLLAAFVLLSASLTPAVIRGLRSARVRRLLGALARATSTTARLLRGPATALAVFVLVAASFAADWREYAIAPDSWGYAVNQMSDPTRAPRPPAMSIWIELFSDGDRVSQKIEAMTKAYQSGSTQIGDASDPILRPVQAQRLFLAFSFAVFAWALTMMMPVPSVLLIFWVTTSAQSSRSSTLVFAGFLLILLAWLLLQLRNGVMALRGWQRTHRDPDLRSNRKISRDLADSTQDFILVAAVLLTTYSFGGRILEHSFVSEQQKLLYSDALAMCWHLLFAACMAHFIWTRRGEALLGAALFGGIGYLTRSASVFLFGILACLLVLALWWDRRRLVGFVLGAAAIAAVTANSVTLFSLLHGGEPVASAPMLNWGPAAFAIEVAQPEDKRLLGDEQSRLFLEKAIAKRKQALEGLEPPEFRSLNLGVDLYRAAEPAAYEVLPNPSFEELGEFLGRTSRPILWARSSDYAGIVVESFRVATGLHPRGARSTRLFSSAWDWLVLAFLVALAFGGRNRDSKIGFLALLLLGMHLTHVGIVSAFDCPLERYIYATEPFVVIAIGLLLDHHIRAVLGSSFARWREFRRLRT